MMVVKLKDYLTRRNLLICSIAWFICSMYSGFLVSTASLGFRSLSNTKKNRVHTWSVFGHTHMSLDFFKFGVVTTERSVRGAEVCVGVWRERVGKRGWERCTYMYAYLTLYRIAGNFQGQNICGWAMLVRGYYFRGCCLHLQVKVVKVLHSHSWVKYSCSEIQTRKPWTFGPPKMTRYTVLKQYVQYMENRIILIVLPHLHKEPCTWGWPSLPSSLSHQEAAKSKQQLQ